MPRGFFTITSLILAGLGGCPAFAQGNLNAGTAGPLGSPQPRTLTSRFTDTFKWKDFGALGTNSATAVGTSFYGTTYNGTLAGLAAYTAPDSSQPLAWMTNPAYGLTTTANTTMAQTAAGTTLQFLSSVTQSQIGGANSEFVIPQWIAGAGRSFMPSPGMLVTGPSCIAASSVIAPNSGGVPTTWGIAAVPVRAGELLPAITNSMGVTLYNAEADWAPTTTPAMAHAINDRVAANGGHWIAIAIAANGPYAAGYSASGINVMGFPSTDLNSASTNVSGSSGATLYTTSHAFSNGATIAFEGQPAATFTITADNGPTTYNGMGVYSYTLNTTPATTPVAGAVVATPASVTYGGPTYAGSYGLPWSASYLSTPVTVVDGGVTWKLIGRENIRMIPTGSITLNTATSSACANNTAITFTLAPAAVQALTLDYIGIQTAMYKAATATQGGTAEGQDGVYIINHSLVNAAQTTNTNSYAPAMHFKGSGRTSTQIITSGDFGYDQSAIVEANQTDNSVHSTTLYDQFTLVGGGLSGYASVNGTEVDRMNGMSIGEGAQVRDVNVQSFGNGLVLANDHQAIQDSSIQNNGCNIRMADYTATIGNQIFDGLGIGGASVGVFCVPQTAQIDSAGFKEDYIANSTYGFVELPPTPNVSAGLSGLVSGSNMLDVWIEGVGEEFMHADSKGIVGNRIVGGGVPGVGVRSNAVPDGISSVVPALAVYFAGTPYGSPNTGSFAANLLLGTNLVSYGAVTKGMIEASTITNNQFIGDYGLIFGNGGTVVPTAAVPTLFGPGGFNTWSSAGLSEVTGGEFHLCLGQYAAGLPVKFSPYGGDYVISYTDGSALAGFMAAPCNEDNTTQAPVQTSGDVSNALNNSGNAISIGQPLAATSTPGVGVTGLLNGLGSVAYAEQSVAAGSTVKIRLVSTSAGGAPGIQTLTAAGATQATAMPITSLIALVNSGTGGVLLPSSLEVGQCVRVSNSLVTSTLAEYPPNGWTIGAQAANAAVAIPSATSGAYGQATHCRIGATAYD